MVKGYEPQSKPGWIKVSKGQSQPQIAAAAFLTPYMVLGRPFQYQVLMVTHMLFLLFLLHNRASQELVKLVRDATTLR